MKTFLKIGALLASSSVMFGCAYSPDIHNPEDSYQVEVNVFEVEKPRHELISNAEIAIENHEGKIVDNIIKLPLNQKETLHYYGIKRENLINLCDCIKLDWDFQKKHDFYNKTHLDTIVSNGEWVHYDASKMSPYNEFYVPDSQDFIVEDRSFGIKIDDVEGRKFAVNFHYIDGKMISLDDVTKEKVFVPLDDNEFKVEADRFIVPERKDGVSLLHLAESGAGKTKIFLMTIKP